MRQGSRDQREWHVIKKKKSYTQKHNEIEIREPMWHWMTRSPLRKEPLPFPALSLWKLLMIRPLLSRTHFQAPMQRDSQLQTLLPISSPCLPHYLQLTPFLQRLNPSLVFQHLHSPASTLTHPRQFSLLSQSLAPCPVQGPFFQEAFWTD